MSVQEWGWIDNPEEEVEFTCNMCGEPTYKEGYCSTECFEADSMIDLEPDYKKEYEELTKRLELFVGIMTIVGVVCFIAMLLNIIIRSI